MHLNKRPISLASSLASAANLDLLVGESVDDIVHRNSSTCASSSLHGRERNSGGEAECVPDSKHDASLRTTSKIAKK